MPTPSLDPIDVITLAAGLLTNDKLANIVGPYSVIFLAALGGAGTALGNNKTITTRLAAFWYMSRAVLAALLLTVPTSTFVAKYFDGWEVQVFFIPVSAFISYMADPLRLKRWSGFAGEMTRTYLKNWVNRGEQK